MANKLVDGFVTFLKWAGALVTGAVVSVAMITESLTLTYLLVPVSITWFFGWVGLVFTIFGLLVGLWKIIKPLFK